MKSYKEESRMTLAPEMRLLLFGLFVFFLVKFGWWMIFVFWWVVPMMLHKGRHHGDDWHIGWQCAAGDLSEKRKNDEKTKIKRDDPDTYPRMEDDIWEV